MDTSVGQDVPDFDRGEAAAIVVRVLVMPGGAELVTSSFARVPGAVVTMGRSGLFGSRRFSVQLGQWRYTPAAAGRITVSQVVGGVAVSEDLLPPAAAGPHIIAAVGQHVAEFGGYILPEVLSLLEGLAVASS